MKTTDDVARMAYFDCWTCIQPTTKCTYVDCRKMLFATIAWEMIMGGRY